MDHLPLTCPTCHQDVYIGALFCLECGTQLLTDSGKDISEQRSQENFSENGQPETPGSPTPRLVLLILDAQQQIPLPVSGRYIIGRATEGKASSDYIDLTSYNGYDKGVSRKHVSLTIKGNNISLIDLDSSNGTRINGILIKPQKDYLLQRGDILSLGDLRLQLFTI
jgi:pSer/pThr/pTyr-binding forkhead associated (FHA) protein